MSLPVPDNQHDVTVTRRDNGLITVTIRDGAIVDVALLETVIASHKQQAPDMKSPVLYHVTPKPPFDPDILGLVKRRDVKTHVSAVAAIVTSTPIRTAANAFLGFIDSPFPIRLFDTEQAALDWLAAYPAQGKE